MKIFFACCLFLFWGIVAAANTFFVDSCKLTVKGRVFDANTGLPLDYAIIYETASNQTVIADERGRFLLRNLCKGENKIAVSHIGCETEVLQFLLTRDTSITIRLDHTDHDLDEVIVEEHRKEVQVSITTLKLDDADLNKLRGLTLSRTIEELPGVYSLNTGVNISKPMLNGMTGNRVLIVNNGIRLQAQQWGNEHAPEVDPFQANRISVIKGANSIRYGPEAIGGVILIDHKPLLTEAGIGGNANLIYSSNSHKISSSVMLEGNHEKIPAFAWRTTGSYTRGGNARAPRYFLSNTGVSEADFSLHTGWTKERYKAEVYYALFSSQNGILSSSHIGNLTDLMNAIESPMPQDVSGFTYRIAAPYQQVIHHTLKASASVETGNAGTLETIFAWQQNDRKEFDKHLQRTNADGSIQPGFQFVINTLTADVNWRHREVKNFSGQIGFSGMTQTNNYRYGYYIPGFWNFQGGIYWMERWRYKRLEIEAGVRMDYVWMQAIIPLTNGFEEPIRQFAVPSGIVGLDYHFSKTTTLNVAFSTAWRAPVVSELYANGLHHGAANVEVGNADLKAEKAFHLGAGVEHLSKRVHFTVGLFGYYIRDYIYQQPVQPPSLTIRGAFPTMAWRQADVAIANFDYMLDVDVWGGIHLRSKAALLYAYNITRKDGLIMMPPFRFDNGLLYKFSIGSRVSDAYIGVSVQQVLRAFFAPFDEDYSPPPPAYVLLNAEAGLTMMAGNQPIIFSINARNLLNTAYREYLDRFRYFADRPGVDVSIGIRVPFHFSTNKNSH